MTTDAPPGRPTEPAIEDYGLIGDTGTAALVASDGGPDWMCVARFDGPKVFGRLVGGPDAGCFAISRPSGATLAARAYKPWHRDPGRRDGHAGARRSP